MPKFAVYYILPADDEFYVMGTQILGYDVRTRQSVQMSSEVSEKLKGFDEGWVKEARPYGFHLTIGDAIDFHYGDIFAIEHEIEDILNCFDSSHPFQLKRHDENFVLLGKGSPHWGERLCVLRYEPNDYLKIFQSLIVARVNPLGCGSGYVEKYLKDPSIYGKQYYKVHRTLKFYSYSIFDSYNPHFTLLNPYTGQDHEKLRRVFANIFGKFQEITLKSICLLVQVKEEENWTIFREFERDLYPKLPR